MRAYHSPDYALPLPPGHRFPMAKYTRLAERVASAAATLGIELVESPPAPWDVVESVHAPGYLAQLRSGRLEPAMERRIGFPFSARALERSLRSAGATLEGLRHAIAERSVSVNLAGGTHHAHADRGGGFCILNDSVIAARGVIAAGAARRVVVIDLDVHQGDGTARLCAGDPSVYTFSMHGARNYPATKAQSDFDVALPDGTGDAAYLDALDRSLPRVLDAARADAAIYLAGADPYAGDRLGHLSLTKEGLAERDRRVLAALEAARLPVVVTMGGGYAPVIEDIVDIHFGTVTAAASAAARRAL